MNYETNYTKYLEAKQGSVQHEMFNMFIFELISDRCSSSLTIMGKVLFTHHHDHRCEWVYTLIVIYICVEFSNTFTCCCVRYLNSCNFHYRHLKDNCRQGHLEIQGLLVLVSSTWVLNHQWSWHIHMCLVLEELEPGFPPASKPWVDRMSLGHADESCFLLVAIFWEEHS